MTTIYLSSTFSDLQAYREAVYRALRQMKYDVIAMEDYVATDKRPLEKCLQDVAACDLYVGLFAWRYGYVPSEGNPEHKSITELEYRKASSSGKSCLIFLLAEDVPWPRKMMDMVTGEGKRGECIAMLRQELAKEKIVSSFQSPEHLASLVGPAVHLWEKEHRTLLDLSTNIFALPSTPSHIVQGDEYNISGNVKVTSLSTDAISPRRLRVFLCHSSGDKLAVRSLYQRLEACNIDPWLDEENLLPGQDWEYEIRKAGRITDIVIVCLSRGSISKTGYVQKEIKFVLDLADEQPEDTIFLIPLKLEACDIPERLRRWHCVNYFEEIGFSKLIQALRHRAASLNRMQPTVQEVVNIADRKGKVSDSLVPVSPTLDEKSNLMGEVNEKRKPEKLGEINEKRKPEKLGEINEKRKPEKLGEVNEKRKPEKLGEVNEKRKPERITHQSAIRYPITAELVCSSSSFQRKIIILGCPGSGKSTAARIISEYLSVNSKFTTHRITDYKILSDMFREDTKYRFQTNEHEGFDVLDFSVFGKVLSIIEHEVNMLIARSTTEIFLIEFAANDYEYAFSHFSTDFLTEAYFLLIDANEEDCIQRIKGRIASPQSKDDYFVSEEMFRNYYSSNNLKDLADFIQKSFGENHKFTIIRNQASFQEFHWEVRAFTNRIFDEYVRRLTFLVH